LCFRVLQSFQNKGKKQGEQLQIDKEPLLQIPLKKVNFQNKTEKNAHDTIVKAVENLIQLNQQLQQATQTTQKNAIERAIASLETQIDAEIYQLYALSEIEITMLEKV
jgi:hypothetical protein